MGNVVEALEREWESSPNSRQETPTKKDEELEIIIDLDSAEYKEWLRRKRERARAVQVNECSDKKNNPHENTVCMSVNCHGIKPAVEKLHPAVSKSDSVQPDRTLAPKNSHEFEQREADSKGRIEDVRKKYNLRDRDYRRRGSVVLLLDDKALKREKEERQRKRQQMRLKYKISHRQAATVG